MKSEITNLEPKVLWEHFYELTQIPRPSKKEAKAVEFVRQFGLKHGLETKVDDTGNVIIRKPATAGMADRPGVILQTHLDMVPQKNSDTEHDFEKDPISAYIDGEWVKAGNTTLGADNGIGVAATLAILGSADIAHGPLEALFTVDEETGMTGAFNLKGGLLNGRILMNLDSEDEGELIIGCAGGMNTTGILMFDTAPVPADMVAYKLALTGLRGGHSGIDISLGRGNSNKLLFRFMFHAAGALGMRLASVDGGSLRNAIPRESFAVAVVPAKSGPGFLDEVKKYEAVYRKELGSAEPDLKFSAQKAELPDRLIKEDVQDKLIRMVYGLPNGVIRMSTETPGIVETSSNLAIVKSDKDHVELLCLLRSSVDTAKEDLGNSIQSVMELAGAKVVHDGTYPGWKPDVQSPVLKTMKEVYRKRFGKVPEIKVIHAGLECGIIGNVYPGLDMISFGPTIRHPHSPDEKVHIESVGKFWEFLLETLKNI
jgi:dipeptidase D